MLTLIEKERLTPPPKVAGLLHFLRKYSLQYHCVMLFRIYVTAAEILYNVHSL